MAEKDASWWWGSGKLWALMIHVGNVELLLDDGADPSWTSKLVLSERIEQLSKAWRAPQTFIRPL